MHSHTPSPHIHFALARKQGGDNTIFPPHSRPSPFARNKIIVRFSCVARGTPLRRRAAAVWIKFTFITGCRSFSRTRTLVFVWARARACACAYACVCVFVWFCGRARAGDILSALLWFYSVKMETWMRSPHSPKCMCVRICLRVLCACLVALWPPFGLFGPDNKTHTHRWQRAEERIYRAHFINFPVENMF